MDMRITRADCDIEDLTSFPEPYRMRVIGIWHLKLKIIFEELGQFEYAEVHGQIAEEMFKRANFYFRN